MKIFNVTKLTFLTAVLATVLIATPALSNSNELGCKLAEEFGKPIIYFSGELLGDYDSDDYEEKGRMSGSVEIEGNGNKAKYSTAIKYKKVGSRIELSAAWVDFTMEMEEFHSHFGLFPTLTCTSP